MKAWQRFIFLGIIFSMISDISYAAGMIMRVQQMKARKRQMQEEQYQEYQQEQQQSQDQNKKNSPQETYQQKIDRRNQAIAKAILDAKSNSTSTANVETVNSQATGPTQASPVAVQSGSTDVKEVVDLAQVWKKLDTKSTVWTLLIDDQSKILTVSEYIDRYHQQGVKINEPPAHYVQMIDQITGANPQMLNRPFGELLQIAAIVDYDFDNGMDKDVLAQKVLGEAGYEANKKRFTQQSQQQ